MKFDPPKAMCIESDGSEITLVKTIPKNEKNKVDSFLYKFSKSITKENTEFEMTEVQIKMNLRNFFIEIK